MAKCPECHTACKLTEQRRPLTSIDGGLRGPGTERSRPGVPPGFYSLIGRHWAVTGAASRRRSENRRSAGPAARTSAGSGGGGMRRRPHPHAPAGPRRPSGGEGLERNQERLRLPVKAAQTGGKFARTNPGQGRKRNPGAIRHRGRSAPTGCRSAEVHNAARRCRQSRYEPAATTAGANPQSGRGHRNASAFLDSRGKACLSQTATSTAQVTQNATPAAP